MRTREKPDTKPDPVTMPTLQYEMGVNRQWIVVVILISIPIHAVIAWLL